MTTQTDEAREVLTIAIEFAVGAVRHDDLSHYPGYGGQVIATAANALLAIHRLEVESMLANSNPRYRSSEAWREEVAWLWNKDHPRVAIEAVHEAETALAA